MIIKYITHAQAIWKRFADLQGSLETDNIYCATWRLEQPR